MHCIKSFGTGRGRSAASHASAARCPRFGRRRGVSPTGAVPRNAKPSALATTAHVSRPIAAAAAAVIVVPVVRAVPVVRGPAKARKDTSRKSTLPLTATASPFNVDVVGRRCCSTAAAANAVRRRRSRRPRESRSPSPPANPTTLAVAATAAGRRESVMLVASAVGRPHTRPAAPAWPET